jgi:hypothetical protein
MYCLSQGCQGCQGCQGKVQWAVPVTASASKKVFAKVKTALAKVCQCIRLICTSGMGLAFLLGIAILIEKFLSFQIAIASGSDKYFFVF